MEESNYLNSIHKEYLLALKQVEVKWAQKAHLQWIINGDNNTKLFHTKTKIRRQRNFITSIEDNEAKLISNHSLLV